MTPTPPPPLDIVTVAIALASWVFGAQAASAVGTYAVIVIFAIGGAAWSAGKRTTDTRLGAFWHGSLMVLLALGVTVPLAEALHHYVGLESRWTVAGIAALVAARPEWVVEQLRQLWGRRAGLDVPPGQGKGEPHDA